mgnify:FL=1
MNNIITVNSMTKDYGNGRGIFDFNFSVRRGEIFGLVGTNGSGKTTTLRHLMGFLKPDSGSCEIAGMNCWKCPKEIMKKVGYVPGEIDFPDVGNGTSFLKIQAQFLGVKDMSYTNRLVNMFKLDTDAPLKRMSKGMKQKTALIAAFMAKPDILLLDEPSTGLDPLMRDTLIELILEQRDRGTTVFMSSHIFKELEDTCDRVAFIHNGKMIDMVSRDMYDLSLPKQYRIGFEERSDYQSFIQTGEFEIIRQNDKYKHLIIAVGNRDVNKLFSELVKYDIRYIKYVPYTLEMYYTEVLEKGGKL